MSTNSKILTWESDRFNRNANFFLSGFVIYFCCWNWISRPFLCKLLKTALVHDFFPFLVVGTTKFCIEFWIELWIWIEGPFVSWSTKDLANIKLLVRKFGFDDEEIVAADGETGDVPEPIDEFEITDVWWCCCWYFNIACVRIL